MNRLFSTLTALLPGLAKSPASGMGRARFWVFFLFIVLGGETRSQAISSYVAANIAQTYACVNGTVLCNSGCTNTNYTVALPWSFTFNSYTTSSIIVNTNGWIEFGTGLSASEVAPISSATAITGGGVVAAYAINSAPNALTEHWTCNTVPQIVTQNNGTSFTIEWQSWYNPATDNVYDVQITLYQTTNSITCSVHCYGAGYLINGTSRGQLGIRGLTNAQFENFSLASGGWAGATTGGANTNASTMAITVATNSWNSLGTRAFTFTPPTCAPILTTLSDTICQGSPLVFHGRSLDSAGTYVDTVTSGGGCDTIITLHLAVRPISFDTISQSICSGDSVFFDGTTYHLPGYYSQVLTGHNGCDSTSTLHLTVKPLSYDTIQQTICSTDSVNFGGQYRSAAGYYSQVLTGSNGCDSTVTMHLIVKPVSRDTTAQSICSGDSAAFGSHFYRVSGYYPNILTGINGCDSILTLHLTVNPLPTVTLNWQDLTSQQVFSYSGLADTIFCTNKGIYEFSLRGGTPAGGSYSGGYIHNDTFDIEFVQVPSPYVDTILYTYIDSNGCTGHSMDTIPLVICEGINEINPNQLISLYPNPNTGSFTLQTSGRVGEEYIICDIIGRQIDRAMITAAIQQIDLPLSPGIYQIVVRESDGGQRALRFEVQR